MDSFPIAIIGFQSDGTVLYANKKSKKFFNKDPEKLIQTSIFDILPHETVTKFQTFLKKSIHKFEIEFKKNDNNITAKIYKVDKFLTSLDCFNYMMTLEYMPIAKYLIHDEVRKISEGFKNSLQKYEQLEEVLKIGIWEYNYSTSMFLFNEKYYKLHEMSSKQVGGFRISVKEFTQKFVHEGDSKLIAWVINKAMNSNNPNFQFETDMRILTIKKKIKWIRVYFRVKTNAEGKITKLIGINHDITEKKNIKLLQVKIDVEQLISRISNNLARTQSYNIENEIDNSLSQIGKYFNLDRIYIFRFKDNNTLMDNIFEWCNKNIEPHISRLKNLQVNDFPSVKILILKNKASIIDSVDDLNNDSNEKKEFQLEKIKSLVLIPMITSGLVYGFIGADSVKHKRVWTENEIKLLQIVGEIIANALTRKAYNDILKESEERFRFLIQNSSDIIAIVDSEGNHKFVTSSIEKITGFSINEILRKNIKEIIHPDDLDFYMKAFKDFLQNQNEIKTLQFRLICKDGTIKTLESIGQNYLSIPFINGILVNTRDITDRKKQEEEILKRKNDLERFEKVVIGREIKMIELKNKIKQLEKLLNKKNHK
jgi:PAS domain S-box-containing protein